MTSPRSHLVDPSTPGFYHCISRCVRRAVLCDHDELTGRSFEHRKQWVEDRLLELAGVFAVGVYAYAEMSKHLQARNPGQASNRKIPTRQRAMG